MTSSKKITRNTICLPIKVHQVLSKFQVDLNLITVSTTPYIISISGTMLKKSGHDLPAHEMVQIVNELSLFASIRTDLTSWSLTDKGISYRYHYLPGNIKFLEDVA